MLALPFVLVLGGWFCLGEAVKAADQADKKLTKVPGVFGTDVMESAPLVYQGRPMLLHSRRVGGGATPYQHDLTYLYLVDLATGQEVTRFGAGCSFGSVFVHGDEIHVFATEHTENDWTHDVYRFWSTDLKTWNRELAIAREPGEHLFNTSVCHDEEGYVMTYELNVPVQWCFRFARSKDLRQWEKVPGLVFTGDPAHKNAGNPVIRYFKPYYYVIYGYGPVPGHNGWLTGIARSKDLVTWQLSPRNPMLEAGEGEGKNNTDADLEEIDGQTVVYYATGDQWSWMELKRAIYPGPMRELLESYFPEGEPMVEFSARE